MKSHKTATFLLFTLALLSSCQCHKTNISSLQDALVGFLEPQDTCRTKLWWFHSETETTKEGITADLEAFKEQGVGGVVFYDQTHGKAEGALDAMSPRWWETLIFAAEEAQRLGLSFEVHVSNGYVAGGPWITPDLAMQRLSTCDTLVQSQGAPIECRLPQPKGTWFRDEGVLAIPAEEGFEDSRSTKPTLSTNIDGLDLGKVLEDKGELVSIQPFTSADAKYIELDFSRPITARSLTYCLGARGKATTSATNVPGPPSEIFEGTGYRVLPDWGELEVSSDGIHYTKVCSLKPIYRAHSNWKQKTLSFPASTGRYFRLYLHDWNEPDEADKTLRLGGVKLSGRASVDQWEEKAGLFSEYIEEDRTAQYSASEVIDSKDIVDLSEKLSPDGTLFWDNAPEGKWRIIRFCSVPTGAKTKHGRASLLGLECDKMSSKAAKVQWDNYFSRIADSLQAHGARLEGMAMDSHEAGSQNWTEGFPESFEELRGYSLKPYLPMLEGFVVGSVEESDAFLRDIRRTIADLVSTEYYGTFNKLCTGRGFKFTAQATGNALCLVADQLQAKGQVQKPQGEFWAIHPDGNYDIKESSSAARIYGKGIASAEAFTDAKYSEPLSYLKSLADYAYGYGINEFVVCASAYQPWLDKVPGNTAGGRQYCLNRNNTYWPYSRPFWDYQARMAYLMRQGKPIVDYCLYLGEDAPVKILTHRLPEFPAGYDFDAFTTDALLQEMSAHDGLITTCSGMSYKMMILPRSGELSLRALRAIARLVKRGARVWGPKPKLSGSLKEELSGREEFDSLVSKLWGSEELGQKTCGQGQVLWGMSLKDASALVGITPDISVPKGRKMFYAHRALSDSEIYFIDNHEDSPLNYDFSFRTGRSIAEIWNPVNGERYQAEVSRTSDQKAVISLNLASRQSLVVVFRDSESPLPKPEKTEERCSVLDGPWSLSFADQPTESFTLSDLSDWTLSNDPHIRYYSGLGAYRKELNLEALEGGRYVLRFERLADMAQIIVNGQDCGILWCSPWEIDVTKALHAGANMLEIRVVNSLVNRLIGDASLPEEERSTYCTSPIVGAGDPLAPSGIIGKVYLVQR